MSEEASQNAEPRETSEPRDFVRYTFLHLRPEWRRLPLEERRRGRDEAVRVLEGPPAGMALRTYSLVGTKAGVEGLLWAVSSRLELFQHFESRLWGTALGGYLDVTHSYLGLGQRSEYFGGGAQGGHEGGRVVPGKRRYLFVYPFVKKREWYSVAFEERRRIMAEHVRIGHRFPQVEIHTGYSFGLDDPEFILSFEADSPAEFLDLVVALRPSEASRYTHLETPIFTCAAVEPRRMLELADGIVE